MKDIDRMIEEMKPAKKAALSKLATEDGMTLKEYLIDLYGWADKNTPKQRTIIIKNSVTGDIIQN